MPQPAASEHAAFVGVDVSKVRLDVHVHPSGPAFAAPNTPAGVREIIRRLRAYEPQALGVEASGGYERACASAFLAAGLTVYVLDPAQVRAFARALRRNAKTDAIDAETIARLVETAHGELVPHAPDAEATRLAQLLAHRLELVRERARLKGDLDKIIEPVVARMMAARRAQIARAVAKLDKQIAARMRDTERFARLAGRLAPIPGVGPVLTATLAASLPELGRLSSRAVAALVGVAPFDRASGAFDRGGRCRGGRARVRAALYMATLSAIRCGNPQIAPFYERLRAAGKPAKPAIVAAMRKLLTILNAVVRDDKPWAAPA